MHNSIHDIYPNYIYSVAKVRMGAVEYIDFTSGIFAASLGMANHAVRRNIEVAILTNQHCYQYGSFFKDEYLKKLCEFTGYESAYMFSSGTEAVEAAWKVARRTTHREGIAGLTGAFHGKTLGAQIAAGREADWRNQTPPEKTAAIIIEPYNALTCQMIQPELVERLERMRQEYGMMLIADEIQAGFYRTGRLFGFQHYPIWRKNPPDLVCIGKAMTNGLPGSAVLGPSYLIDDPQMDLSSTNGGHPLVCAAGSAVIDVMNTEKFMTDLLKNIEAFESSLPKIAKPAQGIGMVGSIYCDSVEEADDLVVALKDAGLLVVHTKAQTIKLGPPLNIPNGVLKEGFEIINTVVK